MGVRGAHYGASVFIVCTAHARIRESRARAGAVGRGCFEYMACETVNVCGRIPYESRHVDYIYEAMDTPATRRASRARETTTAAARDDGGRDDARDDDARDADARARRATGRARAGEG